jgi:hypothetical protein
MHKDGPICRGTERGKEWSEKRLIRGLNNSTITVWLYSTRLAYSYCDNLKDSSKNFRNYGLSKVLAMHFETSDNPLILAFFTKLTKCMNMCPINPCEHIAEKWGKIFLHIAF